MHYNKYLDIKYSVKLALANVNIYMPIYKYIFVSVHVKNDICTVTTVRQNYFHSNGCSGRGMEKETEDIIQLSNKTDNSV